MAITDLGPVVMHEGAGYQREGVKTVSGRPRRARRLARPKIRRLRSRQQGPPVNRRTRKSPVAESETNPNVTSYHTSKVDAPLGYQGMWAGK